MGARGASETHWPEPLLHQEIYHGLGGLGSTAAVRNRCEDGLSTLTLFSPIDCLFL